MILNPPVLSILLQPSERLEHLPEMFAQQLSPKEDALLLLDTRQLLEKDLLVIHLDGMVHLLVKDGLLGVHSHHKECFLLAKTHSHKQLAHDIFDDLVFPLLLLF